MRLIVFGEDWGAHPSSTQHLLKYISNEFDVYWVNSIGLRRPKFCFSDIKRLLTKLIAKLKTKNINNQSKEPQGFPVIKPWVIPLPKNRFELWLNKKLIKWQLKHAIDYPGAIWVWTSLPSAIDFKDCLNESGWFYYCGDDFSSLSGVDHHLVKIREEALVDHAQCIWVVSEYLHRKFDYPKTTLIEHGVDTELFSTKMPTPIGMSFNANVIGFYGAIADWLNQPMLFEISNELPDWHIVLVGPILTDISLLSNQTNIHFIPSVPHHQLPAYLQSWNVAILPFIDNEQIRACNPLKLREYLASGCPIISTPFPALETYKNHVYMVYDATDAIAVLNRLDLLENPIKRQNRMASVENESWQNRANVIKKEIIQVTKNISKTA